jgi:hypothetical protein
LDGYPEHRDVATTGLSGFFTDWKTVVRILLNSVGGNDICIGLADNYKNQGADDRSTDADLAVHDLEQSIGCS